jgi:phage shock protein A
MSMRLPALVLLAALSAGAARAQTYDPAKSQQRLNQEQLDIQSQQLQQLQRQNNQALQQPDPGVRAQAAATRLRIQQQTDAVNALRQQMQSTSAAPSSLNAQLQASGAAIQQLQTQTPLPVPAAP